MAITTRDELKTAVTNWYRDRQDLAEYTDEFIELSEGYLNVELRCREMEAVEDLTPVSNVCALPADYLEYKRVVELASIRRPLEYITEDAAEVLYPTRASGLACHFMIIGNNLTALPLTANDIELTFYQKIPALTEANTTNWLLTRLPNLYLHACLMHAAEFVKEEAQLLKESTLVQKYIGMLHSLDNRAKFGNAGMTIPGVVW